MNAKYLILIGILFLLALTGVSAQDNTTAVDDNLKTADESIISTVEGEKLEKTYFYDADTDEEYEDDTVVTHNVVKYYGDRDTKFKVKVYDEDYNPEEGVYVSFGEIGHQKEKRTNKNGIVYFPINYKVGQYEVETYIESEDGKSSWTAYNTVKIKSTIPVAELVKYSTSKKKFKIRFLDTKGHALKNTVVKLKIKGKKYKIRTNAHGIVKIKSTGFKVGKTKIIAYNPVSGETRKISVVVLKKGLHKVKVKIDGSEVYCPSKKLKNGDRIYTVYSSKYKQYNPGVYIEARLSGLENPKHTKLIKAKIFFKNKRTGQVITKVSSKVRHHTIKVNMIRGYTPYKATVWYRDK